MIYKEKEADIHQNLHGGEGEVGVNKLLNKGDAEGLDLFATVTIPTGASIGYHQHLEDSEGYYILSGAAEFTDADGKAKAAEPGDLCLITKGESHGIKNIGDTELKILAIVY